MTQTTTIESFAEHDPAVTAWQQAFAEVIKVVPEAVEITAQKIGRFLLQE